MIQGTAEGGASQSLLDRLPYDIIIYLCFFPFLIYLF
jgi:hypothetical protein